MSLWAPSSANAAVLTETGLLNPDWTPWPSVGGGVVEFETRLGGSSTWELGHKFDGTYLDTSGEISIQNGGDLDFTLNHDSTSGLFTLTVAGGPSTTWASGRPGEPLQEIWLLAKTSKAAYTSTVKNLILNGSPISTTLTAANNKIYAKIYGETFSDFTLQGTMNFSWASGSPSGSTIETLISVVFPAIIDTDGDGIVDGSDNCPTVSNLDQADCNANDIGDVCDSVYPGATEVCDGLDNNCNGFVDDGLSFDNDGDGHFSTASCLTPNDDCNDTDPDIFPGNSELCDGLDNNCDGQADEGLSAIDIDGDGYTSLASCGGSADDCDDGDPNISPGTLEVCDGFDNNCDGLMNEGLNCDLSYPVQLKSTLGTFTLVQDAYDSIPSGFTDTIRVKEAEQSPENLIFDRDVTVRLEGGYDAAFTGVLSSSEYSGTLTVSGNPVTISDLIIK